MATEVPDNSIYNALDAQKKIEEFKESVIKEMESSTEELHKLMMANGLFEEADLNYQVYNNKFYPLKRIDPYNVVEGTKEVVFFTKPSIPVLYPNTLNRSPYFTYLNKFGYTHILEALSGKKSKQTNTTPFLNILTNRIKSNLDIPDLQVDALETAQNFWGTKLLYPKSSMSSDEGASFTAEFEDTKYLEIYHLFKAWDEFRRGKWLGIYFPDTSDIINKILYDHIAVYKFIIANDGETLLYWCKWTGVYPESISRSTFSEIPKDGPLNITIGFKLSGWFEDMTPEIIYEFNALVNKYYNTSAAQAISKVWDISVKEYNYRADQSAVRYPYIFDRSSAGNPIERNQSIKQFYFEWIKE